MTEIETPLGAVVRLIPAPEHLGDGVLLVLSMKDPQDRRTAEVYLDPDSMTALRQGLEGSS